MGLTSGQRNGSVKKMKKSASGNLSRKRRSKACLKSTEYYNSPGYRGSHAFYSSPNGERIDLNQRGCKKCYRKNMPQATSYYSRRPNVKPRMHVVDNYPANSELFRILFGCTSILRLGLFHFIQRITRTLRIDHIDFYAAAKALSACLYREDPIDVENVKLALRDGRLGSRNKKGQRKKRLRNLQDSV